MPTIVSLHRRHVTVMPPKSRFLRCALSPPSQIRLYEKNKRFRIDLTYSPFHRISSFLWPPAVISAIVVIWPLAWIMKKYSQVPLYNFLEYKNFWKVLNLLRQPIWTIILRPPPLELTFAVDLPFFENVRYKNFILPVFSRRLAYNTSRQFSKKTDGRIPNIFRVGI